jgi:NitT/TauT family transport system substrate-binding protein
MKAAGLLKASTDPAVLARRAWLDLDGVTDLWISALKIERIAGGGPPPHLDDRAFVALLAGQPVSCCNGK